MEICRVGAELFKADGRRDGHTDMTMLIVAFRDFVNAPKDCDWKARVKIFCGNTGYIK
jgi:hypothetical protein